IRPYVREACTKTREGCGVHARRFVGMKEVVSVVVEAVGEERLCSRGVLRGNGRWRGGMERGA
ncbi:unnamed protein product, partial [Dovyalis caffra]